MCLSTGVDLHGHGWTVFVSFAAFGREGVIDDACVHTLQSCTAVWMQVMGLAVCWNSRCCHMCPAELQHTTVIAVAFSVLALDVHVEVCSVSSKMARYASCSGWGKATKTGNNLGQNHPKLEKCQNKQK